MDEAVFHARANAAEVPVAPRGLEQILATFGDIHAYIQPGGSLDPRWEADYMTSVTLPFAIKLSWDHSRGVTHITCHKRLAAGLAAIFAQIQARGLEAKVSSFGGCFAYRQQRTGRKLSAHSWGIAIDLNPETNQQGSPGDMDTGLVQIFHNAGFEWGGEWPGPVRDPMHFQFCSGY